MLLTEEAQMSSSRLTYHHPNQQHSCFTDTEFYSTLVAQLLNNS